MTREERREDQKRRLKILFHRWNIEEYREAPEFIAFCINGPKKPLNIAIAFPTGNDNFIRISFYYGISEIDDIAFPDNDRSFSYAVFYLNGLEKSYNLLKLLEEDKEER